MTSGSPLSKAAKRKQRQSVSLSEATTPYKMENNTPQPSQPSSPSAPKKPGHKGRRSTSLSQTVTPLRPIENHVEADSSPSQTNLEQQASNEKKDSKEKAREDTVPTSALFAPQKSFAESLEIKKPEQPINYVAPRHKPSATSVARQYLSSFDASAVPHAEDKYYTPKNEPQNHHQHHDSTSTPHYAPPQPTPFGLLPPPPGFGFAFPSPTPGYYPAPPPGYFYPPPPHDQQFAPYPVPPFAGHGQPPANPYFAFPPDAFPPLGHQSPQNTHHHHSQSQPQPHFYQQPQQHRHHQHSQSIPVIQAGNSLGLEQFPFIHSQSLGVSGRRSRSASGAHDVPVDVPTIEEDVEGEEREGTPSKKAKKLEEDDGDLSCTGCGAEPVASFVALIPCDHIVCHTCMNSLINSAAHSPPRPVNCFKCASRVESFLPAFETTQNNSLMDALKESWKKGEAKRLLMLEEEKVETAKWEKRMFGTGGSPTTSTRWSTPVKIGAGGSRAAPTHRSIKSIFGTSGVEGSGARASRRDSIGGTPEVVENSDGGTPELIKEGSPTSRRPSFSATGGAGLDWSDEIIDHDEIKTPEQFRTKTGYSGHFNGGSVNSKFGSANKPFRSPVPPEVVKELKEPISWPVVRIDNIPWDITAAEIESWLPQGCLAPMEECVLAVHILCNRADGRTLNQCYIECATVQAARDVVRLRDGRKLRSRPAHVTISDQTEFMSTIFPSWEAGFDGLEARPGHTAAPLIMQTELTGLVNLCRLESPHACKVNERPYFNIVTVLQKFPWHQLETYNSKQIVRLYNTSCAAVEILHAIKHEVHDWQEILSVMVDAVVACPVLRPAQKAKFTKKTGLRHPQYPFTDSTPDLGSTPPRNSHFHEASPEQRIRGRRFSFFSPPSLRDNFVTVGSGVRDEGSPTPSAILDLAPPPPPPAPSSPTSRLFKLKSRSSLQLPSMRHAISTPNLGQADVFDERNDGSPPSIKISPSSLKKPLVSPPTTTSPKVGRRRVDSVSKNLGADPNLVLAIAAQLGVTFA